MIGDRRGRGAQVGTLGNIVDVHNDGEGFAVEFFEHGETIAVATVFADQVRPATDQDIAARRISA